MTIDATSPKCKEAKGHILKLKMMVREFKEIMRHWKYSQERLREETKDLWDKIKDSKARLKEISRMSSMEVLSNVDLAGNAGEYRIQETEGKPYTARGPVSPLNASFSVSHKNMLNGSLSKTRQVPTSNQCLQRGSFSTSSVLENNKIATATDGKYDAGDCWSTVQNSNSNPATYADLHNPGSPNADPAASGACSSDSVGCSAWECEMFEEEKEHEIDSTYEKDSATANSLATSDISSAVRIPTSFCAVSGDGFLKGVDKPAPQGPSFAPPVKSKQKEDGVIPTACKRPDLNPTTGLENAPFAVVTRGEVRGLATAEKSQIVKEETPDVFVQVKFFESVTKMVNGSEPTSAFEKEVRDASTRESATAFEVQSHNSAPNMTENVLAFSFRNEARDISTASSEMPDSHSSINTVIENLLFAVASGEETQDVYTD